MHIDFTKSEIHGSDSNTCNDTKREIVSDDEVGQVNNENIDKSQGTEDSNSCNDTGRDNIVSDLNVVQVSNGSCNISQGFDLLNDKISGNDEIKQNNDELINVNKTNSAIKHAVILDTEKCPICGQFLNNSDIIYYQGHPQDAVEEFVALTHEKLVLASGK